MGHTNQTTNLHLPQFVGSDKPTWLSDVNGAMLAIDTAYGTIEAEASSAATAAAGAVTTANAAQTAADSAASAAATAGTNASQALSTANNAATVALQAQTDAAEALEIASGKVIATVTADGVKTYSELLTELYADAISNCTIKSRLVISDYVFNVIYKSASILEFGKMSVLAGGTLVNENLRIEAAQATNLRATTTTAGTTFSDRSAEVATNGLVFTIYA